MNSIGGETYTENYRKGFLPWTEVDSWGSSDIEPIFDCLMGPNHLSNLRLPIVNILAIFIMSNYFLNYLTSHSAGPDRGQAAGGYRDRVFVLECYDGT